MTKLEFLLKKCQELTALADILADIDEETGETFERMAYVIQNHIGCLDPFPLGKGISEYQYAIQCVSSTVAKLQAVDTLYNCGALRITRGMGAVPAFVACVECWQSFFQVDNYPFTNNESQLPTTLRGVMGAFAPGAYT